MTVIRIKKIACNFCGKNEDEVSQLITADSDGNVAICNECVGVCVGVLEEHVKPASEVGS